MRSTLPRDECSYSYAGMGYANPHAVTSVGSTTYTYDNNGNVTTIGSLDYTWDGGTASRPLREAVEGSRPTATTIPASGCSRRRGVRPPPIPTDTTTSPRALSSRRLRYTSSR